MNIFLTGMTGYVGSHLVSELINHEHKITALVRITSKYRKFRDLGIQCIIGDISDPKTYKDQIPKDIDAVIHLAFSLFPKSDPQVNLKGAEHIINLFKKRPIKRFIFVSSALVYGPTPLNKKISEQYLCSPKMVFAKQQFRAENLILKAFQESNFPATIVRPSEIFGGQGGYFKEQHLDGIIKGKVPIIGNGLSNISMTHVDDVVQAIYRCLIKKNVEGEIFNINIPETITTNDLVELIRLHTDCKKPIRLPKLLALIAATCAMTYAKLTKKIPPLNYDIVRVATMKGGVQDISKAKKILGFTPKFATIKEGLEVNYFNSKIS